MASLILGMIGLLHLLSTFGKMRNPPHIYLAFSRKLSIMRHVLEGIAWLSLSLAFYLGAV